MHLSTKTAALFLALALVSGLAQQEPQIGDVILDKLGGTSASEQSCIALLAFVIGCMMLCGTEQLLKLCLVIVTGVVVGIVGMNQVAEVWTLDETSTTKRVAGIEIGLIAAYISYLGYDGLLAAFGAFLGLAAAHKSKELLDSVHLTFLDPGVSDHSHFGLFLYYSVFTVGAMRFFNKNAHLRLLGVGCSVIGGALVASALSWGVTYVGLKHANMMQANGLTPVYAPWTNFLYLLVSSHSPDVGLFAGSRYNQGLGGMIADRLLGQVIWAFLSLFGIFVQWEKYGWNESAGEYMSSKTVLTEQLLSSK